MLVSQACSAAGLESRFHGCSLSTSNHTTARTLGNCANSDVNALLIQAAFDPPVPVEPTSGKINGLLENEVIAAYGAASACPKLYQPA
jgi:hypothetical protein